MEDPERCANGSLPPVREVALEQSLIETLNAHVVALRAEHDRLDCLSQDNVTQKRMEEILDEEDAINDLLSFQKPVTLRECILLIGTAERHLDRTLNGSVENEDREKRQQTGKKVERIHNAVIGALLRIAGLPAKASGLYESAYDLIPGERTADIVAIEAAGEAPIH
jgi:hypothetical protein